MADTGTSGGTLLGLDASAMVDLLLDIGASGAVQSALRGCPLSVPAHFDYEVLSAIGRLHRAGELTDSAAAARHPSDIASTDPDVRVGQSCGMVNNSTAVLLLTNRTNLLQVTEIVNMHEAKTNFSKLVAKVEAGEEIVIARGGKPCARLVPIAVETPTLGTMKDRWPELADEFFAPLTGNELDAWNA